MEYKLCKFCENRTRDTPLRGVYIPHFGQISVKISVLGSYNFVVTPMGVKYGKEEGTEGHGQISPPSVKRVAPAGWKTSKSASEQIKYRQVCTARNVASKYVTSYFMNGHRSLSCKGTCADVIEIQTQSNFCCCPSVAIVPLHYLLNFRVFYILFSTLSTICQEVHSKHVFAWHQL